MNDEHREPLEEPVALPFMPAFLVNNIRYPPPLPPLGGYNRFDAMNEEAEVANQPELADEAWAVEGDLGRMLTWQDLVDDGYHLYKFTTGRTFKNRGYYENKLVEFYQRIFYAYPEALRSGMVDYDPNIHDQQTHCYEAQLQRLEERIAEARVQHHQVQGMN